jgi:hypothetical protein
MRKHVASFLMFAALLYARPSLAEGELKVGLGNDRDWLQITVANVSQQPVLVGANFSYGEDGGPFDLSFEVRDSQGRNKDFLTKAEPPPPETRNLLPGRHIHTKMSFDELALDYMLAAGTYDVTATYHLFASDGSPQRSYRSNTVRIRVEGDENFHIARMKQRGELYDVDLSGIKNRPGAKPEP